MKVFLIILAVIVVLTIILLSLSATFTIIYDNKWTTKIKVLWIEKDFDLIKILDKLLMSKDKKEKSEAEEEKKDETAANKADEAESKAEPTEAKAELTEATANEAEDKQEPAKKEDGKKKKPNYIQSLWEKEGIVGILDLVSNLLSTLKSAGGTLFRGFHIHSLYVKMIVGGGDAAQIALSYGRICQFYYPIKGIILHSMKVDNYDDMIYPDYIAPGNEFGLQFIGSISVGLLLKVVFAAVKTFGINLIKK